jgi:hypothetical protein
MTDKHEFERAERDTSFDLRWRGKLARALDGAAGEETRRRVMEGAEKLTADSSGDELIEWTRGAMGRLERQVGEDDRKHIMTQCACQYPKERLEHMRRKYAETRDLNLVHRMLQEQFLATTKDFLDLDDRQLEDIRRRGWGVAGVREGGTIVATKMPFEFHRYFEATTPEERRYRFCHCQGVREVIRRGDIFPKIYCYCGAGFYRGIWEHILQRPVKVEVLESVLFGGDFCRIAIHLSHDA